MKQLLLILLFLSSTIARAEEDLIFSVDTTKAGIEVYKSVYESLEAVNFYVIFEANIGKNLARNAQRWGDEYNKNKFDLVRSMLICNPYYANQVLNLDPKMMALCPITVTLLTTAEKTTILFARLTPYAKGSAAEDTLWEVENTIMNAIKDSVTDSP